MSMIDRIGETLTIVRHSAAGEIRTEVKGSVQADKVMFGLGVDVEEGDVIEQPVAAGKVKAYRAVRVTHYKKPARAAHIEADTEPVSSKPAVAPRRLEIPGMHRAVSAAAGALFADQHYSRAVFAAFQAVEHRVQEATGSTESGVKLMHQAFEAKSPAIDVSRHQGRNAADERLGFQLLFAGSMQAIRNPRGHGQDLPDTADEAMEYLALASLFMRRLDYAGV